MSAIDQLVPMTVFALTMACTPGPNNIMLTSSGANFGFARTLPHMAGVTIGFLVLLVACAGGLGLLFAAYPSVHTVLKIAGVIYLLWLAWKIAHAGGPGTADADDRPITFLQAALFQWVNPKGMLAAISAVTLFLGPAPAMSDTLVMLAVFSAATVISVVLWAGFGTLVSRLLANPLHARFFNMIMGLLLVLSIFPMVR